MEQLFSPASSPGVCPQALMHGSHSRSACFGTEQARSHLTWLCWPPRLSDCNKENTLHSYGTPKGSLKAGEQRVGSEVSGESST